MSALAVRNKNGEKIYYSGSQFDGFENIGTHHLCIRTGSGENDVQKYGLTSTPLNDKYKALRMKISDGATGKDAYIAQKYISSMTHTASYSSGYDSSQILASETNTGLGTKTTKSITCSPLYYGRYVTESSSQSRDYTSSWTVEWNNWFSNGKYMFKSSGTSYFTSSYVPCIATIYEYRNRNVTQHNIYTVTSMITSTITQYSPIITNTLYTLINNVLTHNANL